MKSLQLLGRSLLTALMVFTVQQLSGQSLDKSVTGASGLLYEHELSFGIRLNTKGWGVFTNFGKKVSFDKSRFYHIEFAELRHPKEIKQSNDFGLIRWGRTPKPFVFGKQNNFYALHFGWGRKIFLGDKAEKSGVEVNWSYILGPSLGILKPYYLDVIYKIETVGNEVQLFLDSRKYDPDDPDLFLNPSSIYGSTGFLEGIGEIKFYPGIHAKTSLVFDWANYSDFVKAIEAGISVDAYYKRVPIMIQENNKPYFVLLYLGIQFGKKW